MIVNKMSKSIPGEIKAEVNLFRYRERFKLSYEEAMNEPAFAVQQAFLIWEMEDKRDKLESGKPES